MAHFAEIDENNLVTRVLAITQENVDTGKWGTSSSWVQTSYNTRGGVHYAPNSNEPDGGVALRKNYASKGYTYDPTRDAFIAPQPYPSWTLDEDSCFWISPVAHPMDGKGPYEWDEDGGEWVVLERESPE
jgi:hypothetical protein